ncbi:hypothetical protein KUTeg_006406 [Tegillarca granosa]|uniref:Ig-like domain-containing protein n=1 Tax=Tegillarca granosa TaxID=220873 RepID=A0ABQ9FKC9_TEGGR|nr:hypothetical protein KUTeg_006406 [Tegillarca granosa]
MLIERDRPRKPTLPNKNSYVGKSLELTCDSQKTSKPDYYTPELNYTWFLNGSIHIYKQSHQGRYRQIQNRLIIDNVTRQDRGNRFSCKASDRGQQSEQSEIITLDPLCK